VTAADLGNAARELSEGDGATPRVLDERLRRFARVVASAGAGEPDGCWLRGVRGRVADAGPVPGCRF
jgi:hypothetical protein